MSRILNYYGRNIFETSEHYIKVIFPFNSDIIANGDNNGGNNGDIKTVLDFIKTSPEITAKRISVESGLSERKISRIIRILRENNIITRVGSSRNGYWKIKN